MLILFVYCLEALDADTFLTQKPLPRLPSTTPKLSTVPIVNLLYHELSIPSCTYAKYQFFYSYTHHQHSHFYNQPLLDNSEQLLMALHPVGDGENVGRLIE